MTFSPLAGPGLLSFLRCFMPPRLVFVRPLSLSLTLLLCAVTVALLTPVVALVRSAEVTTLKGEGLKGEIVRITDKELVLNVEGKEIVRPLAEVLQVKLKDIDKLPEKTEFADIELTDGTILRATQWNIKKKELEAKLLLGPTIKMSVNQVASILSNAHIESFRKDWTTRVQDNRGKEILVVLNKSGLPQSLSCTFGDGDDKGETLKVAISVGEVIRSVERPQNTIHGLIFKHPLDPKAPPILCKLFDTSTNLVMVGSFTIKDGALLASTPVGVQLNYPLASIGRLDFSKGRLDYLSDLEEIRKKIGSDVEKDGAEDQIHITKNYVPRKEGGKAAFVLGGVSYNKGLFLRAHVDVEYDLRGDYREFTAVVGIDDSLEPHGTSILEVQADGAQLAILKFGGDIKQRVQRVAVNVKDRQKLRIIVRSGGILDLCSPLNLADAKVSK